MRTDEITTDEIKDSLESLTSYETKVTHFDETDNDELMTPKKFIASLLDPRSELYKHLYTIALEQSAEKAHEILENNQYLIAQTNEEKRSRAELKAKILANIKRDEELRIAIVEHRREEANEQSHPLSQFIPHELVDQLLKQSAAWEQAEAALSRLDQQDQMLEDEKQSNVNRLTQRLIAMPLLTLPKGTFNDCHTTFTLSDRTTVKAIRDLLSKRLLPTAVVLNRLPEGHPVHDMFMQTVNQQLAGNTDNESLIRARQFARNHMKLIPRHTVIEMAAMIPLVKAALIAAHGPDALDTLRTAYATNDGQPYGRPPNVIKILEDGIKNLLEFASRETDLTRMDDAQIRNTVERQHHTAASKLAKNAVQTILLDIIDRNPDVAAEFEKIRQKFFPADMLDEQEHRAALKK